MVTTSDEMEEYIMVFPTSLLYEIGYFQGLLFDIQKYLSTLLDLKSYTFIKRKEAEIDFNYKQIIPYVLLIQNKKLFVYRRGKLSGEKRLLGNYSIGIGGHITINDPCLFGTTYYEGLYREINEEIKIDSNYKEKIVALINDDSNDVGRVHFGIVHIFSLDRQAVSSNEKAITEAEFSSIDQLKANYDGFENWSKICIDNIDAIISLTPFSY